jgi:hypothetical protein
MAKHMEGEWTNMWTLGGKEGGGGARMQTMMEFGSRSLQRKEGAGGAGGEGEGGDVEQARGVFHQERGLDRYPHGRTTRYGGSVEGGGGRGGGSGGGYGYSLGSVKDAPVWTWIRVRLVNLLRITRDGIARIQDEIEATFPEEEKEAAFQCRWRDQNRAAVGS